MRQPPSGRSRTRRRRPRPRRKRRRRRWRRNGAAPSRVVPRGRGSRSTRKCQGGTGDMGNTVGRERVVRMSVEQPLWRALTGYRLLTLVYAIGLFASSYEVYERPWVGAGYFVVLAVWTLATLPQVSGAGRCTKRFLTADLTIAVA